ncbi:hypothetical protein [Micavibrio aeruginosavorus]|uniref:Uncharacterized protein n=1 Tax=Micavibrio aeruginosavorus EPB TaxID=349215 RepID=M4VLS3_9BACT|nr:hypothetical protein [Micavibrio aeruginosavorus]AGH99071.1 hypothetical protein A11S_2275 [Micavibrio aeruginosavorus EPB]
MSEPLSRYEGPELMARLAGIQSLQTLAGTQGAGVIANFARENGLDQAAPKAPETNGPAANAPAAEQGWTQILGNSGPSNNTPGAM